MKYVLSKRDSQTDMTSLKGIFIILLTVNVLAPASNNNLTLDCEDKVAECLSVIPPCDNQELQQCPKLCGICYSTPLMNTDNNSTCTDDPECTNYSLPFDCNSTTPTWPSEHCLMSCNLCQDYNLSDTTVTPRDEESTSVGKSSRIKVKDNCTDNPGCVVHTFPDDCNLSFDSWPREHCLVSCNLCSQQVSTTVHSIIDNKSSPLNVKTSKGTTTATRITTTVLTTSEDSLHTQSQISFTAAVKQTSFTEDHKVIISVTSVTLLIMIILTAIIISVVRRRKEDKSYLYAVAMKTSSHFKSRPFVSCYDAPPLQPSNSPPVSSTVPDIRSLNPRDSFITKQMSRKADIIMELRQKTPTHIEDADVHVTSIDQTPVDGETSLEKWINNDGLIYTVPDFSDFQYRRCYPPPLPPSVEYAAIDVRE